MCKHCKRNQRGRIAAENLPDTARRPWTVTIKNTIAGGLAFTPIAIEIARALQVEYGWFWLGQFIMLLGILTRIVNSRSFEVWAAKWAPWLTTAKLDHDKDTPTAEPD